MSSDFCIHFLLFFLLTGWAAAASSSSSSFISYDVFTAHGTGRSLLQTKTKCTENFENKNYTIITSECKGPKYPADKCCKAFKEFACPIRDKINDMKTDCASTMFSYINLYGKYPPGLFANECREGKEGLECKDPPPAKGSSAEKTQSISLMLTLCFLVLLLLRF